MKELDYKDINEFLSNRGVVIEKLEDISDKQLDLDTIKALNEFHKLSKGYKFTLHEVIPSFLGKRVEDCLVDTIKLKRFIQREEKKANSTEGEKIILQLSKKMISRCEKDINNISRDEYRTLINRSVNNMEVCVGNSCDENIKLVDNIIYIGSVNQCNYNLIEEDYIKLILCWKKKLEYINLKEIISYICYLENLDDISYKYIEGYIDFPYNFMKNFNRYREKKKNWNEDEYKNKILRGIEKDGLSILN
ncbi:hypothetical protein [Clostridium frigidicarnis]|uniref:Spore coat protein, CotS family n=1 Tax=Clostridium frigidicarnis TaxID=84698 RepID=A0A1I0ZF64_9CLOT|nr:hypothetical protein [Clostridium frigidicarnis]SFB24439.1 hypothetical protein SAMN04488528_102059 [Clostridium frigidicarnis]